MDGILSDVKVLELAHAPSGAFCAKLLADQGADTIKVEPPGSGRPKRAMSRRSSAASPIPTAAPRSSR